MMQLLNINNPATVKSPSPVNGRGLRNKKLTAEERVSLAADLASGQRQLAPSLAQVSAILGVTPAAVRAELKARQQNEQASTASQESAAQALVEAWNAASDLDREIAVDEIGVADVWDAIARVVA